MTVATLAEVVRAALVLVFGAAVLGKLSSPKRFATAIDRYKLVPIRLVSTTATAIIIGEVSVVVSHVSGRLMVLGSSVGVTLLLAFGIAVLTALRQDREIPCGCFPGDTETVSIRTMARIAILLAAELFLLVNTVLAHGPMASPRPLSLRETLMAIAAAQGVMWLLLLPELVNLAHRLAARLTRQRGTVQ